MLEITKYRYLTFFFSNKIIAIIFTGGFIFLTWDLNLFLLAHFRPGSVIVEFKMTIVCNVNPQELIEQSKILTDDLTASADMETTGNGYVIINDSNNYRNIPPPVKNTKVQNMINDQFFYSVC